MRSHVSHFILAALTAWSLGCKDTELTGNKKSDAKKEGVERTGTEATEEPAEPIPSFGPSEPEATPTSPDNPKDPDGDADSGEDDGDVEATVGGGTDGETVGGVDGDTGGTTEGSSDDPKDPGGTPTPTASQPTTTANPDPDPEPNPPEIVDCLLDNADAIISFEKDGAKNKTINTQYKKSHGVSFKLSDGKYPILAQVNKTKADKKDNPRAWRCAKCTKTSKINGTNDQGTAALIGNYVLTMSEATHSKKPASLIVSYDKPVAEASGYLIDIDGGEKWDVVPMDEHGKAIAGAAWTYKGGKGGKAEGNGVARKWVVSTTGKKIHSLKITGAKKKKYFGFAFDQFSPAKDICK